MNAIHARQKELNEIQQLSSSFICIIRCTSTEGEKLLGSSLYVSLRKIGASINAKSGTSATHELPDWALYKHQSLSQGLYLPHFFPLRANTPVYNLRSEL